MDDYVIVTCIGKGSSGAVYLARSNRIKKLVAIKKIQIDESRRSRCRRSVIREANILRTLNHFHIVKCYEWFLEDQGADISMVLEYCDGGTMQDRIASVRKNKSQIPEQKILEWTTQIASAVEYIHERKILHRDLKSENVFLLKSEVVKLGDFGISKEIGHTLDKANTCVGTPCYLSPELCQDIPYNFKSDIWALGCLVFEMCALKPAFDAANLISLFYKIVNGKYSSLPGNCSPAIKDLISRILVRDPDKRPTAHQLLQLPTLQRYTNTIRTRSPELIPIGNDIGKKLQKHKLDTGDLDDLDELLTQAEKEFGIKIDPSDDPDTNNDDPICNRSLSVYDNYGTAEFHLDGAVDNEGDRPQTCPHSASKRPETYTPADTIATWSGYGDRGSKRPSATRTMRRLSGGSDSLSEASTLPDVIPTRRDYSSDEFSSLSDDDRINTARTAATVDEEIPEEIESFDDTHELQFESENNSSNILSVTASRNLPGSSWLHTKRAQVLRQNKQLPQLVTSQHVMMSSLTKRNSMPVTSYSLGSKNDFVAVKKHSSMKETNALSKKSLRKERLPGSSWLKNSSRNEIVLGDPMTNTNSKKKRENLPGSGWLLSKSHDSPRKDVNADDYPDDFEDYDDDFEADVDDDTEKPEHHVSSLEFVKQKCIDSIGREAFEHLGRLFKRGFSIGEAYEKCKSKVPFETVETCYLLLN